MQAVAATGIPFPGQAADFAAEVGLASIGQSAKRDSQTQSETSESSFLNIFTQGIGHAEKLGADLKIDGVSTTTSKDSESELSFGDTSVIGGVFARLFVLQGSCGALETQTGEELTELTPVSAAAPQTGYVPAAASAAPQDTREPAGSSVVSYGENVKAGPVASQNEKTQQSRQRTAAADEQTGAAVSQSNVTEKIMKVLKSMGGEDNTGQSFGEFISEEKKPALVKTAQNDTIIGSPLPFGIPADRELDTQKNTAVEKALDRFLNDFKGVEASSSEIQIVLEPESLGTLAISVSRTKNGISAKIQAEDKKVCAIVSDQIQKLVESMENKGITVEQIDVVFGQTGQNLSFTQNSFGSRQQNKPGYAANAKKEAEASGSSGFFDLWQVPSGGGEEGNDTVEYRV